jgi:hypothetical protein
MIIAVLPQEFFVPYGRFTFTGRETTSGVE